MLKVKNGDLDKLGLLFERYHRSIYRYFFRMCRDEQVSEDLVQSVFERILKYRKSYSGEGKFSTWLFSIARNQFIDHHNRNKKNGISVSLEESRMETSEPDNDLIKQKGIKKGILEMALNELGADKKEVIILSRYEGLKYKEIAELQGTTEGAIKVKVYRAMKELRDLAESLEKEYSYE